jgi:DNA-directed RNA polymerase specialized sigma24 family protein
MPYQLPFGTDGYADGSSHHRPAAAAYNRSSDVTVYYRDDGGSGDEHQADDLVQETITKLYVRWSRISGVDNLDAYVHTMLVRIFLDEKRRGWWRVRLGVPPDRPAPVHTGDVEERALLRAALSQVPPR